MFGAYNQNFLDNSIGLWFLMSNARSLPSVFQNKYSEAESYQYVNEYDDEDDEDDDDYDEDYNETDEQYRYKYKTDLRKLQEKLKNTFVVFGTTTCPYTKQALELLEESGKQYQFVDDKDVIERIKEVFEQKTVPLIFFENTFIGGLNDGGNGGLNSYLQNCSSNVSPRIIEVSGKYFDKLLEDTKDHYLMVYFKMDDCPYCIKQFPIFQKMFLAQDYKQEDHHILQLSMQTKAN